MPHVLLLAHPLTERDVLPVAPLVAAVFAVCLAFGVGFATSRVRALPRPRTTPLTSWEGTFGPGPRAGRVAGVLLLVVAIVAGRVGRDSELDNLAPALVVGVAWPLLVILSSTLGPVWRWLDPWDSIARATGAPDPEPAEAAVHPGAVAALLWVGYLSANPHPFSPRALGLALAVYTLVTIGGCFLLGRRAWLARGEVFGLLFAWCARLPRGRLPGWAPPPGAAGVLGVLAGGLLFGSVRASELWGSLNTVEGANLYAAGGVAAAAAAGAALVAGLERWARARGAPGTVIAACVPAVAALAVALALGRNRLSTSLQLLPGLLGDPLGRGWDLLGEAGRGLDPAPLGDTGLVVVQLAVVAAGMVAAAVAVALRLRPPQRWPCVTAAAVLGAVATAALASV